MSADHHASSWTLDATSLLAAYADHSLTPTKVVEQLLERIEALDKTVNSIVALSPTALDDARRSTSRWQGDGPVGRLDGVPILVKDNLEVAGMPATLGSALFRTWVPEADELPIARLRAAGAIILGKTNCPEFALEGYTANELHGVTVNPYDRRLTSGGSSGGAVSAVAMGFSPIAVATDGGGSLRRPPAYTGLYGLKPSTGRVARSEALPQFMLDLEVVGPLARSLRDIELLLNVLEGPSPEDPVSQYQVAERLTDPARPLRILYAETVGDAPCDPDILSACGAAVAELRSLGYDITIGELPFEVGDLNERWPIIGQTALASLRRSHADFDRLASEKYRRLADLGERVAAHQLFDLLQLFQSLRREVSLAFETWDIIVTPCCAAMPWPADEAYPKVIAGQPAGPRGHAIHTAWVNACHLPAMALPTRRALGAMPVGLQIIGHLGQDRRLIAFAKEYQALTGRTMEWPDLPLRSS